MKSVCPHDAYHFMMCQRIGRLPTVIIGFGIRCVASPMRTPRPPQKITTFIAVPSSSAAGAYPERGSPRTRCRLDRALSTTRGLVA